MAKVNVLKEILNWSFERPAWQGDALRRLVTKGELNETDISELSSLCKSSHGLGDRVKSVPLEANHLPQPGTGTKPVSLQSLTHHDGVNALASNQTIEFGPSLTVVYGANAAGKSGYTRILKRACRARGAEEILGNVVSGTAPGRPSATIRFMANDKSCAHLWDDDQPVNTFLSRVSVFDHHCASVYVAKRTDVAFRPMGLDVFDKLSEACEAVKKLLEKERNELESQNFQFPDIAEETAVHDLVTNLTSLTDPASVKELAFLTDIEKTRSVEIRERIRDLRSADPQKMARAIELRANRAAILVTRVTNALKTLSDTAIEELFAGTRKVSEAREVVSTLQRETFREQPLANTGSDSWRALWNAAKRFSTADAYQDRAFPFTGEDARCVLCQQQLAEDGVRRLQQFQEFLNSAAQSENDRAAAEYDEKHKCINEVSILDEVAAELLDELHLENADLADEVRACLNAAVTRREEVNEALAEGLPRPENLPRWSLDVGIMTHYIESLKIRAKELREADRPETISKLSEELSGLEARKVLVDNESRVLEEIERKKKIAAYELCVGRNTDEYDYAEEQ